MTPTPSPGGRLAAELRALRARSGLSLAALAVKSAYSKSSWERYLNGRTLPPWPAVRTLCALADGSEPKVRALWELAETAWSGRAVVASSSTPTPTEAAAPVPAAAVAESAAPQQSRAVTRPRSRTRSGAAVLAGMALCGSALTAGAGYAWQGGGAGRRASSVPFSASASRSGFQVRCRSRSCEGADPIAMLCGAIPQTLAEFKTAEGAGLQIRYNPQCQAAWARAWNTRAGDQVSMTTPGQPTRTVLVASQDAAETFRYTPMVAATADGTVLQACLTPVDHGRRQCFTVRTR
ncbi:helix-turn-helix domain-containing protein [Streptacidiphilus sp. PAMC 29251]